MNSANFYKFPGKGPVYFQMGSEHNKTQPEGLELLKANSIDASNEKHVPVVNVDGNKLSIKVGSEAHPMTDEHYIEWISVKTTYGGIYFDLMPGDAPEVQFKFTPEEIISVYAYCNLHGLWKAKEPVLPASFVQNTVACSPEFTEGCVNHTKE